MPTHLPQNQFISDSVAPSPLIATDTAGAYDQPPVAPAGTIDHINEIFFYARKLIADDRPFVLDEAAFMADIEEVPLFIREDGYLKRQA